MDDVIIPADHELELTFRDDRNIVISQFDCIVIHFDLDNGLILGTDEVEEANVLIHEYQDYQFEILNLNQYISKVELEWPTIEPLRLILFDSNLSPAVKRFEFVEPSWDVEKESQFVSREPTLNELTIRLKREHFGFMSKVGYVPILYRENRPYTCYCKGQSSVHEFGEVDDCEEIITTTRRLEYNPLDF